MPRVPCRVCKKTYDGTTHCSVDACRPCAMFFQRSETWKLMPKCRTGRNDCKLDKAGKITCSTCRYQRCVAAGLIQKKNSRSLKQQRASTSNCLVPVSKIEEDSIITDKPMFHSIQMDMLIADTMPMMKRFCHFYAQYGHNKKRNELALLSAERVKITRLPGNRYMGRMTYLLAEKIMHTDIEEIVKLMDEAFPAFTAMDNKCQDSFIYQSMYPLFELAASFRSLRVFNDVNCKRVLCTEAMYVDPSNMGDFIEPSLFANPMDYKTVLDFVTSWWSEFLNTTHRLMHRIKITDMEFVAVCALTIWDEDSCDRDPQLSQMAEKHRTLIYKDLGYYYKNLLLMDNYVERIMNLKELSRTIKKNYYDMREGFHFLRTFNYYDPSTDLWTAASKVVNACETILAQ